jgi:hypothetical protein
MRRNLQPGEQQLLSLGNIQLTNARVLWSAEHGGRGRSVALQLARVDASGFTFVHKPVWIVVAVLLALMGVGAVSERSAGFGTLCWVAAGVSVLAYLWSRRFEVRVSAGDAAIAVGFGGSRKAAPQVTGFLDQVDAAAWTARVIEARGQLPVRPAAADPCAPPGGGHSSAP